MAPESYAPPDATRLAELERALRAPPPPWPADGAERWSGFEGDDERDKLVERLAGLVGGAEAEAKAAFGVALSAGRGERSRRLCLAARHVAKHGFGAETEAKRAHAAELVLHNAALVGAGGTGEAREAFAALRRAGCAPNALSFELAAARSWQHGDRLGAAAAVSAAVESGAFVGLLRGAHRNRLDTHGLSRHCACAASLWYLRRLVDDPPESLDGVLVLTGWGAHSAERGQAPSKQLVRELYQEVDAPFSPGGTRGANLHPAGGVARLRAWLEDRDGLAELLTEPAAPAW